MRPIADSDGIISLTTSVAAAVVVVVSLQQRSRQRIGVAQEHQQITKKADLQNNKDGNF